jgi:hypothetical protein
MNIVGLTAVAAFTIAGTTASDISTLAMSAGLIFLAVGLIDNK